MAFSGCDSYGNDEYIVYYIPYYIILYTIVYYIATIYYVFT